MFLILISAAIVQGQTGSAFQPPKLKGIINLPDRKCALLELSKPSSLGQSLILSEGQREGPIEVIQINPGGSSVKLSTPIAPGQPSAELTVSLLDTNYSDATILLENADIEAVLALYSEFTQRTLLRRASLTAQRFSLRASAATRTDAALVLENALASRDLATIPDGTKFIMVVAKSEAARAKPRSSELRSSVSAPVKPPPSQNQSAPTEDVLPAGVICFRNVDLQTVATIYAQVIGRELDRTAAFLPAGVINIRTQTSLTKQEACYALETLFNWSRAEIVLVGDNLIRVVPMSGGDPGK